MEDRTYSEGFSTILNFFKEHIGVDEYSLLLLLHLYRCHYFDNYIDAIKDDSDVISFVQKCQCDATTAEIVNNLSLEKPWREKTYVKALKSYRSLPSGWYEKYYSQLFDDLLSQTFNYKRGTGIIHPKEITKLIYALAEVPRDRQFSIYDPFCGMGSFATDMPQGCTFVGQEMNGTTYALSLMRIMAHGVTDVELLNENSFEHWMARTYPDDTEIRLFDLIVSFPPIGVKHDTDLADLEDSWELPRIAADDFFVSNGKCGVWLGSTMVGVFGQSVLFRGGASALQRKQLVENGWVDTVVTLPGGLLPETSVPLCVVVLRNKARREGVVRFIDATSFGKRNGRKNVLLVGELLKSINENDADIVRNVSIKEIKNNDFYLNPQRYLLDTAAAQIPEGFIKTQLSEIACISKGESRDINMCRIVKGNDLLLNSDPIAPIDTANLQTEVIRSGKCNVLTADTILVSRVGQLKPTLFKYDSHVDVTCNSDVVALNFDSVIFPPYIISELRKDYVKKQFDAMAHGSLSLRDILRIKILMPVERDFQKMSFENEQRLIHERQFNESHLKESLRKEREMMSQRIRIIRHRIYPYLSGLKSNVGLIAEQFEGSEVMNQELGQNYSFFDALQNMKSCIPEISDLLKAMTEESNFGTPESFSLRDFLANYSYTSKMPDRPFHMERGDIDKDLVVDFNKVNLKEILDEILHNAEKHFPDGNTNNLVGFSACAEGERINLFIMNNGVPVPDDFDEGRSFVAGYHKDERGTGIGLFRVKQICEAFDADVFWANDVNDIMPVGLCIAFRKGGD